MTDPKTDPLYTVTIFFLDGKRKVLFCDGIDQPLGGQWLQLVQGVDTPHATSVHYNVELIDRWISRNYDSSDPLDEGMSIMAGFRHLDRATATHPPETEREGVFQGALKDLDKAVDKTLRERDLLFAKLPLVDVLRQEITDLKVELAEHMDVEGEVNRLVLEITNLEHDRDSADENARYLDVHVAELRQTITLLEARLKKDWFSAWERKVDENSDLEIEIVELQGKLRELDPTNPLGDTGAYPGDIGQ